MCGAGTNGWSETAAAVWLLLLREFWKFLLHLLHLWHGHVHDVRIPRIPVAEVLVVFLSRIEGLELHDLGHNRRPKDLRLIQLFDIGPRQLASAPGRSRRSPIDIADRRQALAG